MGGASSVDLRALRRIAASLALLLIVAGSLLPSPDRALLQKPFEPLDSRAQSYLERTTVRALSVYATCRVINASISVFQESSVEGTPGGMGVSIAVGQVLDPVNDLIERFSLVLLFSTAALAVMQVLIKMGAWFGTAFLLPLAAAFGLAALWLPGGWMRRGAVWGGRFLMLALVVRLAAPAAALLDETVYDLFLSPQYETAAAALAGSGESIAVPEIRPEGESVWGQIKGMVDNSIEVVGNLPKLKELAERLVGEVVTLVAIFLIQTALIPLLVLWLLGKTVSAIFAAGTAERMITGFERAVWGV